MAKRSHVSLYGTTKKPSKSTTTAAVKRTKCRLPREPSGNDLVSSTRAPKTTRKAGAWYGYSHACA